MQHLEHDQRILDFCGESIKPGYWISVNEDKVDKYIKFDFKIKGASGNLGAIVIGDSMTHRDLNILEAERQDYFTQKADIKQKIQNIEKDEKKKAEVDELKKARKELDAAYIPIDFDAYSIEDKSLILNQKQQLKDDDQIWRISSLTAFVDDETKILLLPLPESKRKTKIIDTKYSLQTVGDLINQKAKVEQDIAKKESAAD